MQLMLQTVQVESGLEQSKHKGKSVIRSFLRNEALEFTLSQSMRGNHVRAIHKGIRYSCEECGHQFTQKGDLARHKKSVHGIKRDYPCDLCDYAAIVKTC